MVSRILEEMCEEVVKEAAKKADLEARKSVALNMIRDRKLPLEEIAKYFKLSLEEIKELAEQDNESK